MAGVYEALTRGLETGYGLGRQRDLDVEQRRQTAVREQRQATEDERAAKADTRAGMSLALREQAEARQEGRLDEQTRRQRLLDAGTMLGGRQKQIVEESTARQRAGMPVESGAAAEYGQNQAALAKIRQEAMNFFSRTQTGQVDPLSVPPGELYMNLTAATGMLPEELAKMPAHIKDIEAGQQTGNPGLTVKGVNGLLTPQLRRGVGGPDPHGGTIVKKEIIGLDPDPNNPQYVIPRLRVYVDHPRMTGPRMENGATGYYDAPMTKNGSTDPNDPVVGINMKRGFDYMGNMGALAEAVQRPDVADRLAQGAKEAGPAAQKYIDDLTALSRPTKKVISRERVDVGNEIIEREVDETGKIISEKKIPKGATPRMFAPKSATGGDGTLSDKYENDPKYAQQVDYWADLVAKGGTLPPRFAQSGAGKIMFSDIVQRVPQLSPNANEMLANQAEFMGAKAGARTTAVRAATFGIAKEEAYKMADLVTETSAALPRSSFVPVNKALVAYETNTGSVEAVQFGAALNSFINAYARAISPTGQPTVSDKDHARATLSTAQSHAQVEGIIKTLKQEMVAAGKAPETVRAAQRESIRGMGNKAPVSFTSEADAAAAAKAGKIKVGDRITIGGQSGTWQ